MDDSAITELDRLESIDALTPARNPLDLSTMRGLRNLSIDDRPGLAGFAQPHLAAAYIAYNERRLAELEPAASVAQVKPERSWTRTVDLRARLPALTHLAVQTSRVESVAGLEAPELVLAGPGRPQVGSRAGPGAAR